MPWLIPLAFGSVVGWAANAKASEVTQPLAGLEARPLLSDRIVLIAVATLAGYLLLRKQGVL